MKLVELLAKHVSEWPKGAEYSVQDGDRRQTVKYGKTKGNLGIKAEGHSLDVWQNKSWGFTSKHDFDHDELASDFLTAIVTREMWQAERNKQNGGEWKRHRGGKCPVPVGTKVSTRHRDGEVVDVHFHTATTCSGPATMNAIWKHTGDDHDIMAYKIIIQPQADEPKVNVFVGKDVNIEYAFSQDGVALENLDWKPLGNAVMGDIEFDSVKAEEIPVIAHGDAREHKGPFPCAPEGEPVTELEFDIQFQQGVHMEAKTEQMETPFKWRDEVTELNAYIEKYTRERDALIERLASEGFSLIPAMHPVMGVADIDSLNIPQSEWIIGDIIEVLNSQNEGWLDLKGLHGVLSEDSIGLFLSFNGGNRVWYIHGNSEYRFIRRP